MKKRIILIIVSLIMTGLISSSAMAGTSITVSGSGEALVSADMAIITLGVTARDREVLNAQAKVNQVIAQIRTALLDSGLQKENINTDYINIYALYDYMGDQEELTAYNASSTLAIRTEDMDKVGEIIDTAFEAGANLLNGIHFSATDTQAARTQALQKAMEDARDKAEVLAESAGMQILGIESINEGGTYSYDRGVENNFLLKEEAAADVESGTSVQAARLTVSANVTVTYDAEPAGRE